MSDFEYIVLGGGGVGCASAYHLALRQRSVLVLEQFEIGHNRGSSHGESRIIRYSYHHADYVELARQSYLLWAQVEEQLGEKLLLRTGGVDLAARDNAEVEACRRNLDEQSIVHEVIANDELKRRFPQFNIKDDIQGLWQPDAGILSPDQCVPGIAKLAQKNGATIKEHAKVVRIEENSDSITVHTETESYTCKKLVVTPGGWAEPVLRLLGVELSLKVTVEQYAFYKPKAEELFSPEHFPIFIKYTDDPELPDLYGFPSIDQLGAKVAEHHCGKETTADSRWMEPDKALLERLHERAHQLLPGLSDEMTRAATCLYTNTADKDFIIDKLPGRDNIVIGAGFSGHGFKFTILVGRILSELALDGSTDSPISLFKISRFKNVESSVPG